MLHLQLTDYGPQTIILQHGAAVTRLGFYASALYIKEHHPHAHSVCYVKHYKNYKWLSPKDIIDNPNNKFYESL